MGLKLENGAYVPGVNGLPVENTAFEELLQNARMRLTLPRGAFPYGRELGSALATLDRREEHLEERALALANEALLEMPGVRAVGAVFPEDGRIVFTLETMLGEGRVTYEQL